MISRWLALFAVLFGVALPAVARAHGLEPIGVSIREEASGEVLVRVDRPATLPDGARIEATFAPACTEMSASVEPVRAGRVIESTRLRCEGALSGREIEMKGLDAARLDAIVRIEVVDGHVDRALLGARAPRLTVREAPGRTSVLGSYVALGAEHLARGADHLAFILGIALLARRGRRIAVTLTAFTAGHSITLSAVALGLLRLPTAWAELGIAATLVWLALEVIRGSTQEMRTSKLAAACGAVGLVHGLGFAAALADVGLPERDVPLALFGFNAGIELAQLALVLVACLVARVNNRLRSFDWDRARPWAGHAIGAVAAMWCIERLFAL